ncbi:hypothetical protein GCM10011519_12360 [Marmoricola endophyticus]|uniref:DUF6752 domain-containing protein n=1 Tax=Marmoricola endophyticus TaxID=2040280 RepID=A0A917F344_9ACTN|nr:DUF6752 domain-containing protein [Marmoricola endophyticus]GGF40211.1 hypothetical protein GCM10011519_12360 [Marmoricola endophyticus]
MIGSKEREARLDRLEQEVASLRVAVAESQRLNERLSDVLDVVMELLVPAVDRDEERLRAALASVDRVVNASPRTP